MMKMKNEYLPYPAIIESIRNEGFDTKTFKAVFEDKRLGGSFDYKPGQFVQLSLLGEGEAPISITSMIPRAGGTSALRSATTIGTTTMVSTTRGTRKLPI